MDDQKRQDSCLSEREDFIVITEFSEREGPICPLTIPTELKFPFNKSKFALRVLGSEFRKKKALGTLPSINVSDLQQFFEDDSNGLYIYCHYCSVADFGARGYTRALCLNYITPTPRKIQRIFSMLKDKFTETALILKKAAQRTFLREIDDVIESMTSTEWNHEDVTDVPYNDLFQCNLDDENRRQILVDMKEIRQLFGAQIVANPVLTEEVNPPVVVMERTRHRPHPVCCNGGKDGYKPLRKLMDREQYHRFRDSLRSIHAQFEKNCLDIYVDGHNLELCSLDPNRLFAVGSLSCLDIAPCHYLSPTWKSATPCSATADGRKMKEMKESMDYLSAIISPDGPIPHKGTAVMGHDTNRGAVQRPNVKEAQNRKQSLSESTGKSALSPSLRPLSSPAAMPDATPSLTHNPSSSSRTSPRSRITPNEFMVQNNEFIDVSCAGKEMAAQDANAKHQHHHHHHHRRRRSKVGPGSFMRPKSGVHRKRDQFLKVYGDKIEGINRRNRNMAGHGDEGHDVMEHGKEGASNATNRGDKARSINDLWEKFIMTRNRSNLEVQKEDRKWRNSGGSGQRVASSQQLSHSIGSRLSVTDLSEAVIGLNTPKLIRSGSSGSGTMPRSTADDDEKGRLRPSASPPPSSSPKRKRKRKDLGVRVRDSSDRAREKNLTRCLLGRFRGFAESILFTILSNRTLVILANDVVQNKEKVKKTVRALSLLIPGVEHCDMVEEWRETPLECRHLPTLKIVGMSQALCQQSEDHVWDLVTMIQFDDCILYGPNPKHKAGEESRSFLHRMLQPRKRFKSLFPLDFRHCAPSCCHLE